MVFSSPNLVFVACASFSLVFWRLLLLYRFYSVPPFFGPFFMVCGFFNPCVRHVNLVLHFTFTFHLYFAVRVFSVGMLF